MCLKTLGLLPKNSFFPQISKDRNQLRGSDTSFAVIHFWFTLTVQSNFTFLSPLHYRLHIFIGVPITNTNSENTDRIIEIFYYFLFVI